MTTVVNLRKEPYDIYIGRGSPWGNPYSHLSYGKAKFETRTRDEAIDKYKEWILTQPELLSRLEELRGKRLGCYCSPLRCHGHVLVELLNERKTS